MSATSPSFIPKSFERISGKTINIYNPKGPVRVEVIVEFIESIGTNGPQDALRVRTDKGTILTIYPSSFDRIASGAF